MGSIPFVSMICVEPCVAHTERGSPDPHMKAERNLNITMRLGMGMAGMPETCAKLAVKVAFTYAQLAKAGKTQPKRTRGPVWGPGVRVRAPFQTVLGKNQSRVLARMRPRII